MKLKEVIITLFFLRPAVDAYRVSTNHDDEQTAVDPMIEMIMNKSLELGCESIPGCVLQTFVYLSSPEGTGAGPLISILISLKSINLNFF